MYFAFLKLVISHLDHCKKYRCNTFHFNKKTKQLTITKNLSSRLFRICANFYMFLGFLSFCIDFAASREISFQRILSFGMVAFHLVVLNSASIAFELNTREQIKNLFNRVFNFEQVMMKSFKLNGNLLFQTFQSH